MRAMPYKLEGKGVVEVSQISSSSGGVSVPKKKLHHQQLAGVVLVEEEEGGGEGEELSLGKQIPSSPIDSEVTSTLDITRRRLSSPTSTSTHSSSFNNNNNTAASVADPSCGRKEDWAFELCGSDNVTAASSSSGAPPPMDDWDSMFPTSDGALLPWIIGDPDDPTLAFKHLLHSLDFDQVLVDTPSHSQPPLDPHPNITTTTTTNSIEPPPFLPYDFPTNPKINAFLSPNSPSPLFNTKFSSTSSNCFLFPHQLEVGDEKPQILNPQMVINPHQLHSFGNPSFLMPPLGYCQLEQHVLQPPSKRHNPGLVIDPNLALKNQEQLGHDFVLRKHQHFGLQQFPLGPQQLVPPNLHKKPMIPSKHNHHQQPQQEQSIKDQLFKAADVILTGNFSLAQEILARLNHQLPLPPKPLFRVAFYVKEALQMLLLMENPVAAPPPPPPPLKTLTPYDVVHKMNAYKVFSEVSPVTQFVNFTCTQAILEALDDSDTIHLIDFDIGCGAQWASFIQELPLRKRGAPSLKITALVPLSTSHPFELALIRENLLQFANDIGVGFELQVVNLDLFDPSSCSMPNFRTSEDEAIAVNFPIWVSSNRPSILPPILEFLKQCCPKIVVSFDRGFDRCDVPFPQHLVHTVDYCTNFLESLDGLNVGADVVNKIEKFFVQPRIENTLLGRVHFPEKMPHWKNLFHSAGFSPVQLSNFTETQADYLVKKTTGKGFHVEKRQTSLVLSWQRQELVSASAWRC